MTPNASAAVLQLDHIWKSFGPVEVLKDVSLEFHAAEVHAVLGENGAGKSTLIKIMSGNYQPTRGSIVAGGSPVVVRNPREAIRHGISMVPQDVIAVPELSVARNILLGSERALVSRAGASAGERALAEAALERVGAHFSPDRIASTLSVPEIRLMQIARALVQPSSLLVLDEPTAALSTSDSEYLLACVERLREQGQAVVYITHRLGEVTRLADRVSVLRDGRLVSEYARGGFTRDDIIRDMTRISAPAENKLHLEVAERAAAPARNVDSDRPLLEVNRLGLDSHFADIALSVGYGQIVGIAGVQGSGQSMLLAALAGRTAYETGTVHVDGRAIPAGRQRRSYRAGVTLVPADRRAAGVVVSMSISDNLAQPSAARGVHSLGLRRKGRETSAAEHLVQALSTKCSGVEQLAGTLSGGNQQKIALARALVSQPKLILIDEPTQGIDVNAKAEVRALLVGLAASGNCGIVIATSEFEDLVGLADVIHVLRHGKQVTTLDSTATYDQVLSHALA